MKQQKTNSDIDAPSNKKVYDKLIENGIDQVLATHVAYLFIRDPLVLFDNCKQVNDEHKTDYQFIFQYRCSTHHCLISSLHCTVILL